MSNSTGSKGKDKANLLIQVTLLSDKIHTLEEELRSKNEALK